ncbi:radical SAM protein [Sulfurimonas sp.]|uniref:radical SAM/SPASM domain-containing protein n=1 Tax=Sulfurimonas sp. TaxID=2022749 RepID=UPI0026393CE5|nr:radical SAM protein [Sulfurimonas sp.]MCW8895332.1 SPASM domain-containing protein [Sulfurimonas sp.]
MNYSTPDFPLRLEIELVSDCNLKCTYCPRHLVNELTGYMTFDLFKKIIDESAIHPSTTLVLHRRGESMLHPQFNEMLNYVSGKFKEVQMATNATILNPDKYQSIINGLDFLSFSLDTPERFNITRLPAKYEKVEAKILDFLDFNQGRVRTQASMVKTAETTEDMCKEFINIWKDKVDRVRIYEEHSTDGNFGSLINPREERKPCMMPVYEMLIYDNGIIARCNHDWDSDGMGDVTKNTLQEIWHNDKYKNLRWQHLEQKLFDPVCSTCDSWYPEIGNQDTGEVIEK